MGICWGSPDFPTPSFRRSFPNGIDLTISSTSDTASSAVASSRNTSDAVVETPDVLNSPFHDEELRVFKFTELKAATDSFSHSLGESRFDGKDMIYWGWLHAGRVGPEREIAVNILEFPTKPSRLQRKIMRAKVKSYGCRSHANLARLVGYCLNGRKLFLVYKSEHHYFSLEDYLYRSSSDVADKRKAALPPLPWYRRIQVAVEAAAGLAYLHQMGHTFLPYFQASYILLDKLYAVKIAPFNLFASNSSRAGRTMSKNSIGAEPIIDIEIEDEAATVTNSLTNLDWSSKQKEARRV
ncbi:probable serine/threonine-protein kinase PIX13 isoform X2 [Punica granatum]|uniref:Probable serine/threonine-protein kinase PIX13 isoform X2 n=1 Tax=Punica granatum TaxID=22663 RepID=A0A6P8CDD0_PUNGR|nr:probable serine/threonine-protein kinase PIX13 isoform X2 [Punica granatum]